MVGPGTEPLYAHMSVRKPGTISAWMAVMRMRYRSSVAVDRTGCAVGGRTNGVANGLGSLLLGIGSGEPDFTDRGMATGIAAATPTPTAPITNPRRDTVIACSSPLRPTPVPRPVPRPSNSPIIRP